MAQLTPGQYDMLERAIQRGTRIVAHRRGTEFVVIPISLSIDGRREVIRARNPVTGDALTLALDELEAIEVMQ